MSAVSSEPTSKLLRRSSFCQTSIATTWKLGLASALLVTFLSLSAGASSSASIIRGAVCFLVFGLIGWGINAILVAAGDGMEKSDDLNGESQPSEAPTEESHP